MEPRAELIGLTGTDQHGVWQLSPRIQSLEHAWMDFGILAAHAVDELRLSVADFHQPGQRALESTALDPPDFGVPDAPYLTDSARSLFH